MKVTNTGNITSANNKKKNKKTSAGGDFASYLSAGEQEGVSAAAASNVNALNPLFALQEVDADESPRQQAVNKGFDMLDYLDDVKLSLLDGVISPNLLKKLDSLVQKWRESTDDPELESVIDEIELRAAVELAKLESS